MAHHYPLATFQKRKIREFGYGDIEEFLIMAYSEATYYREIPDIHDICFCFWATVEQSGIFILQCLSLDYPLHRSEISDEFLESILFEIGAEFIDMDGDHINEAQNILICNWRAVNDTAKQPTQSRLAACNW